MHTVPNKSPESGNAPLHTSVYRTHPPIRLLGASFGGKGKYTTAFNR